MTDIETVRRAEQAERDWRERYLAADRDERRELLRRRAKQRDLWREISKLARGKPGVVAREKPGVVAMIAIRRISWWQRLGRRLRQAVGR